MPPPKRDCDQQVSGIRSSAERRSCGRDAMLPFILMIISCGYSCTPGYSRDHPVFLQLSDYFWVKNQSFYQLPYGTKGSEELLMKFLALTSSYQVPPEIERLPCRRCVVVGNGHRLRNSSLGEVINKYDVVIRLNNAPVHKYQKDSADFDLHLDNNPDSLMVLVPFKPLDIQWMKVLLNNEKRVNKGFWKIPPILWDGDPQNIRILNPYYMAVTASKILGCNETQMKKLKPKPTTGMLAITFALHFCDMVHIAGFGYPASTNKKQPIHYYETVTLKSMAVSSLSVNQKTLYITDSSVHPIQNPPPPPPCPVQRHTLVSYTVVFKIIQPPML
uniref:ST3 beta-galactoside alpha-2,3-sialyltransferase 4 n=1 Tax=Leptobrachium leishanense TaxID=445787 RepID=A0A8C5QA51_9ANUR